MASIPFQNEIFLTCGGASPQLILWNYKTNNFIKIPYPKFNSIYVLAIESETMELAAGSRNGLIYIHDLGQVEHGKLPLKTTLIQGSPILSLCWLDNGLLVLSDSTGRCTIWDVNKESGFQSLETHGDIICSLFYKKGTNILYGLSMNGRLLLWDIKSQNQIMDIKIPNIPKIGSLIDLVFWFAKNTLVFPGKGGELNLYEIDTGNLKMFKAHEGSFYSIFLCGDYLISFGIRDCQFKIWCKDTNAPVLSCTIDKIIVSAVCFSSHQDRFLLIDSNGFAYEYLLGPQGFKFIQQLQGQDYRICTSLNPYTNYKLKKKYQKNRAREIAEKVLRSDYQISDNELNNHYNQLTEIGFDHVRLALQADQAEKQGDLFKAIELGLELLCKLPKGNKEACSTMEKQVILIEKTWNIPEACRISNKILKIDSKSACAKRIINSYESSGIYQDSWIIEPDIPLEIVLKTAALVKNIDGRYVIKTLDKIICENNILTPELIVKKYEELQNKTGSDFIHKIVIEHLLFFSNKGNKEIQILSFSSDNASKYIQFAARVICSSSGTIIIPIILFDCRDFNITKTSDNSDFDIFSIFMGIKNCPSSNMYVRRIHKLFYHTLQRLITEKTVRGKFSNEL